MVERLTRRSYVGVGYGICPTPARRAARTVSAESMRSITWRRGIYMPSLMDTDGDGFVSEDEIVTNKRCIPCTESCRKAFVVSITQANDCSSLRVFPRWVRDFKQAEIALPASCEVVALVNNIETALLKMVACLVNQEVVTDGLIRN